MKLLINDIYYDKFFWDESRYYILIGGRGSGKSYAAAQKIICRCMEEHNHKFLVIRKTLPSLKRSCWALFNNLLSNLGLPYEVNKTEMNINLGDNTVMFVSLDDPEKIKSIDGITGIWIEEVSETSENDFKQIDLCLRGITNYYKQIIMSLNPINELLWVNKMFCYNINLALESYKQENNRTILKTTYLDNKYIDEEYKQVLLELQHHNPNLYRISALGLWGGNRGIIYDNYVTMSAMPKHYDEKIYGVDFGFNNPSAVVEVLIVDKEYYIRELVYETNMTNKDLINLLESIGVDKSCRWYCDSAEPARIEEFRRNGFNAWESDKDVNKGIDFVKSSKLHILESSVNLLKEIKTYCWQENRNGEIIDKPCKEWEHLLDGIRYSLFTHSNSRVDIIPNLIGLYEVK